MAKRMADYYPVISRAVSGLDPNTGEARRKVYERARAAILRQLQSIDPPVPEEDIARERMQLEEAIRRVEGEASGAEASAARQAPAAQRPASAAPRPAPAAARTAAAGPAAAGAGSRPAAQPNPAGQRNPYPQSRPDEGEAAAASQSAEVGGASGPARDRKNAARPAKRADGRPIVQSGGAGRSAPKTRSTPLIALGALALIAVVAGLFAARGPIASLFSGGSGETAQTSTPAPDATPPEEKPADQAAAPAEPKPDGEPKTDDQVPQDQAADQQAPTPPEPGASTDQLARAPDATQPPPAQPPADAPAQSGALVAQRAVLYEEGPNQQSGEALTGSVVWRTESVSGSSGQPLDTALKGEIDIPGRNIRAVMTIRRNMDATLPASHTIEIQFMLPPDFANAGVSNVPGVLMKTDESARGATVAGLSVKVTNGFFLIGLSNVESEKSVNEQLLRERSWIDVPILYENGRRAVLTLDKGTPGKQAFDQAFDAWKSAAAAPAR